MPAGLFEHFNNFVNDPKITHHRSSIAQIDAMVEEAWDDYEVGGTPHLWRKLKTAWCKVEKARAGRDAVGLRETLDEVGRLIGRGAEQTQRMDRIVKLLDQRRKHADSELKRRQAEERTFTHEEAAAFYIEEVAALVAPGVAARLDPDELYGVWWFNRRRTTASQVAVAGPEGREYKRKSHVAYKDRAEWIAVPGSGVPREWVDTTRIVVGGYRSPSKLGGRFWVAAIEGRRERMERDRDAVMEYYASAVPGSLDDLVPEERHQVYKMLRLEVLAFPDKSLEVSGAILAGGSEDQDDGLDRVGPDGGRFDAASPTGAGLGALGSSRSRESPNTQPSGLRFRAVLAEGDDPRVQLHTA